jgi:hypothetical protein
MDVPGWGTKRSSRSVSDPAALSLDVALDVLKAQAGHLEQTLQSLRQRIQQLESDAKTE